MAGFGLPTAVDTPPTEVWHFTDGQPTPVAVADCIRLPADALLRSKHTRGRLFGGGGI